MQDTFQWNDSLVEELVSFLFASNRTPGEALEQFKSSKSPKKEWEIVAFRHARGSMLVYKLREDGRYRSDDVPFSDGFTLEQMVEDEEIIHSVRRLSDASEWQVKETVEIWDTGRFIIEAFEVCAGQMLVKTNGGTFLLGALQKLPQPILTTVDGVEIRENEECWIVDKYYKLLPEPEKINEFKRNYYSNCFIFSSRQAAEAYILNNRPLLSLSDVKETASATVKDYWLLMEALSIKVRQKLNQ